MPMNFPDYWGVRKEQQKALREWEKEEAKHIKIKPNATVEEVKRYAEEIDIDIPFYEGQREKKYQKGDWGYMIDERGNIIATYLPSMGKELKIMYEWNAKKKRWDLLTYKEGDW